jgi:hypothetical protein
MSTLLDAALGYAARGWPVFPCHPKSKRPLTPKGEDGAGGLKHATTDAGTVGAWWKKFPQALIGLRTGAPIGVFVVDIDAGVDDETGEVFEVDKLIDDLEREIEARLPETWTVATPRGGRHLYFQLPKGASIGNRAGLLGKDSRIDVRGADGYVVLPPSARPDGKGYAWLIAPKIAGELPARAPQKLIDCILRVGKWERPDRDGETVSERASARRVEASDARDAATRKYGLAALSKQTKLVEQAAAGTRNDALNKAALSLGHLVGAGVLSETVVRAALEDACQASGLAKDDGLKSVRDTITSGLKAGIAQPTDLSKIGTRAGKARPIELREDGEPAKRRRAPPQRDLLIGLTEFCDLWHDPGGDTFITVPVAHHREHWPIRSAPAKRWLAYRFYEETGGTIGGQALEDGLRVLEARAANEGPQFVPFRRVGAAGGKIYLDLCDAEWRAVEIAPDRWSVITKPPVKLLRAQGMRPLPDPEAGCEIDELRRFVNVENDDGFTLLVAWCVAAIRADGPYPIADLVGEQGSGKTGVARMVRSLVDPNISSLRAAPRDERDLMVAAHNAHVLGFDNLSAIPAWLSDALCRLSTGGGLSTRTLHTDKEETILDAKRPILLNGISLLCDRADLASRALVIRLRTLREGEYRPEDELFAEFDAARPRIIGALLDAVCAALRNMASTRLAHAPRLADFAKWLVAASPGLGWDPQRFLEAYAGNRRDVSDAAFDADPVAVAVHKLITAGYLEGWIGSATELLVLLDAYAPERLRKSNIWPSSAVSLGKRIDRAAPLLRAKGITVDHSRVGAARTIILAPMRT